MSISRKQFLKNTAIAMAGIGSVELLSAEPSIQSATKQSNMTQNSNLIELKNVRLETGFEYDADQIVGIKTELFNLKIVDGKISEILKNNPSSNAIDAEGKLMLPMFKDMHIHLDKTFYSDVWNNKKRPSGGVKAMIALEQEILPELLKTSTQRAEKLIELLQSYGSGFARSHVNIEPTSKLKSLENLQKALENKKDTFTAELVAFPQHGLYYTDSAQLMKEAAQMDIDYIGGLDPYSIDGSIEKPMDFTVQLALDYNKGIDIHLHEGGDSGLKTVEYLIKKVIENPSLKGKTYLSHCFVLGRIEKPKLESIAEQLAENQIGIMSTIPFAGFSMPIPTLIKHGVKVASGNDSIIDHWDIFGSGSVLKKANLMAQLYGYRDEFGLSRCLKIATDNLVPLQDDGKQIWPKQNDEASFVLVDAICSSEAVARVSTIKSLYHKGTKVY